MSKCLPQRAEGVSVLRRWITTGKSICHHYGDNGEVALIFAFILKFCRREVARLETKCINSASDSSFSGCLAMHFDLYHYLQGLYRRDSTPNMNLLHCSNALNVSTVCGPIRKRCAKNLMSVSQTSSIIPFIQRKEALCPDNLDEAI